jgi:hypothetical protein
MDVLSGSQPNCPPPCPKLNLRLVQALNAFLITFCCIYFLSNGFRSDGILDGFYEIQARSLALGSLSIVPGPPEFFYHDVSLYHGKYYFYWGLLPSLAYMVIFQVANRIVAHYLIVFAFLFCFTYFYQLVISEIVYEALWMNGNANSSLKFAPLGLTWLFMFNLPLSSIPSTWFFSRFAVYEQQIIFGLALAMPGIYLLVRGLKLQSASHLFKAAFCFSLAAWTRGTWFMWALASIPAVMIAARMFPASAGVSSRLRSHYLWICGAVCLLLGLFILNWVRFDSVWNFGLFHQDPGRYEYLRAQTRFFSPETKFWNFIFNLSSYYGSPELTTGLGLVDLSSSSWEGRPPCFFYRDPQFLLLLVLAPLGIYRVTRRGNGAIISALVVAACALYLNVTVCLFGVMVIMRYFMEFYYLTILCFFAVLLWLVPCRYAILGMVLLMLPNALGTVENFANVEPELRLTDATANFRPVADKTASGERTWFIERSAVWPKGTISRADTRSFRRYNVIGIRPGPDLTFVASDVTALYIIPGEHSGGSGRGSLLIKNLRSVSDDGKALFFVDGFKVGQIEIDASRSIDTSFELEPKIKSNVQHQILIMFLPKNSNYLPPRPRSSRAFTFTEVSLYIDTGHDVDS